MDSGCSECNEANEDLQANNKWGGGKEACFSFFGEWLNKKVVIECDIFLRVILGFACVDWSSLELSILYTVVFQQ